MNAYWQCFNGIVLREWLRFVLQRTTSRHRIFISRLHFNERSAILIPLQGGLTVMGIESLNSAVAAAGFAMVSEEGMDVGEMMGRSAIEDVSEQTWAAPSSSRAIALLEGPARSHSAPWTRACRC